MPQNKFSFSNTLILLSLAATLGVTFVPSLYQFGMNSYFLTQGIYHIWIIQFFFSQFLHGGFLHFLSNAIFILYFGNLLEQLKGRNFMIYFFVCNCIFIGIGITFLGSGNTVGISGFALALLTYYTPLLWKKGNPEYTGGITAIIINLALGFVPGVSFLGHFLGMIFGGIYFYFTQLKTKKQENS